jgi:hypothetical protein
MSQDGKKGKPKDGGGERCIQLKPGRYVMDLFGPAGQGVLSQLGQIQVVSAYGTGEGFRQSAPLVSLHRRANSLPSSGQGNALENHRFPAEQRDTSHELGRSLILIQRRGRLAWLSLENNRDGVGQHGRSGGQGRTLAGQGL